ALGEDDEGAVLRGVGVVLSLLRDRESFQSPAIRGLHPLGEGAGYAGGILSAAIDGMRAAEAWLTAVRV
ncbi:MAG: hypothetical protein ACO4BJ_07780, partial [Planctomycetota bacterium]